MGRVKFRCPECGARQFQFTSNGKDKKTPHGAVCSRCGKQVKASNLYQLHLACRRKSWNERD
ncbi:ECs_2282 family putative zinc-binding protein [Pantoea sp. RRHST58]|uniref:ECs_2282 family putative zinc-binding protein n=1 Tax=Pantoea sp. RRHST58 TaxID=3425183 RepID=UPI003DA0712B